MMRYKLITLPKNVIGIPVISVNPASILFTGLNQEQVVSPNTENMQGANTSLGYTAILSDDTVCSLEPTATGTILQQLTQAQATLAGVDAVGNSSVTNFLDDNVGGITTAGKSKTVIGSQFVVKPLPQSDTTTVRRALLTIIGNETGGFKTISITVRPENFLQQSVATALGPQQG